MAAVLSGDQTPAWCVGPRSCSTGTKRSRRVLAMARSGTTDRMSDRGLRLIVVAAFVAGNNHASTVTRSTRGGYGIPRSVRVVPYAAPPK
jgi:hypothetical protein